MHDDDASTPIEAGCMFEGSVAVPHQTITASLLGFKWSCLVLRVVLQDALRKVAEIYPPLRLRVFVDAHGLHEWEEHRVGRSGRASLKKLN